MKSDAAKPTLSFWTVCFVSCLTEQIAPCGYVKPRNTGEVAEEIEEHRGFAHEKVLPQKNYVVP